MREHFEPSTVTILVRTGDRLPDGPRHPMCAQCVHCVPESRGTTWHGTPPLKPGAYPKRHRPDPGRTARANSKPLSEASYSRRWISTRTIQNLLNGFARLRLRLGACRLSLAKWRDLTGRAHLTSGGNVPRSLTVALSGPSPQLGAGIMANSCPSEAMPTRVKGHDTPISANSRDSKPRRGDS